MADLSSFPDIEKALVTALNGFEGADAGTVTPANLQDAFPFIRCVRRGGSDDFYADTARVDIDVFAGSRHDALILAEQVRQHLTRGPLVVAGVGVVDKVTTDTAPNEVPWSDDESTYRFTASYSVTARR